ncbi:MAG: HAD-IIIA family hydrolase [Bacteroidales bacterium]|nr:HAD-IIIA family hydrolase [Bacteroidales bacterium]
MGIKKGLSVFDKEWTLFLDRDGVINDRPYNDYVKNADEFVFIEETPRAIHLLNSIFKYTFVVTNQQGIGKGILSVNDLNLIHKKMTDELEIFSAKIDEVFFCPDLANAFSFFRKPNVGMALTAKKKYPDIIFKKSVMVGDAISDMQFGKRLGMTTVFISNNLNEVRKNCKLIDYSFINLNAFASCLKV